MKFKVLVCGMARSGIAAAKLLMEEGASVTISDSKPPEKLEDAISKLPEGVQIIAGKNPDDVIQYDMLVLSPGVPANLEYIDKARDAGIPVIGEFELASRFCKAPVLAITGTNGKTTTTAMLYDIMKTHNPLSEIVGNIGIAFSEKAKGLDEKCVCVAEASSFQLETIKAFKPKVSAILNFSLDHLDRHGTFENYVNIKARIFENQDEKDYLVLNYDNIDCRKLASRAKAKVLWFSREVYNLDGAFLRDGVFYLNMNGETARVLDTRDLLVVGDHNYENIMAAMIMAYVSGVPIGVITDGVKNFKGITHRLEYVRTVNDVMYYNDSKGTNTESAIKAVEAMNRPIRLIGGGHNKENKASDFAPWVESFKNKVCKLYIIGEVSAMLEEACLAQDFYDYEKVSGLEEALSKAAKEAMSGEAVLLSPACASWDMFESYEHRGDLFKKIVNELIEE